MSTEIKPNEQSSTPQAARSGDWLGRCVTHHHSCDCRERAIRALLEEVMWWHSDPTLAEYNGCDKDPCRWCECAKGFLAGTMNHDAIVAEIGRPNDGTERRLPPPQTPESNQNTNGGSRSLQ